MAQAQRHRNEDPCSFIMCQQLYKHVLTANMRASHWWYRPMLAQVIYAPLQMTPTLHGREGQAGNERTLGMKRYCSCYYSWCFWSTFVDMIVPSTHASGLLRRLRISSNGDECQPRRSLSTMLFFCLCCPMDREHGFERKMSCASNTCRTLLFWGEASTFDAKPYSFRELIV